MRSIARGITAIAVVAAWIVVAFGLPARATTHAEADELNMAVADFDLELVEELIDSGVNINAWNEVGLTPLIYAIETFNDDDTLVRLLLDKGAKVNVRMPRNGKTALTKALERPETQGLAALLLEHDGDPNVLDRQGYAPLWTVIQRYAAEEAARSELLEITALLLDNKADPDLAMTKGVTPFIAAAQTGDKELITLFLEHEADPLVKDEAGTDAMGLIQALEDEELSALVLAALPDDSPEAIAAAQEANATQSP